MCKQCNKQLCGADCAELPVESNLGASLAIPVSIKFVQGDTEVVKPYCSRLELVLQTKKIPYTLVY